MSYTEYKDMFDLAQRSGKYQMFIIDLAGSKKLSIKELKEAESTMREKFEIITDFIDTNLKILHTNNHPIFNNNKYFILGDLCGFCAESGYNLKIKKIIDEEFKDFKFNYHYNTGFYDTDIWAEGGKKYYFGYCIQQLEQNSKTTIIKNTEIEER